MQLSGVWGILIWIKEADFFSRTDATHILG